MTSPDDLLARTLREEAGPLVARLSRRFGDFDLAEEAVQGAVVEALSAWRRDGPPQRPGAWLQVAADRNAMDGMRLRDRQRALAARADVRARRGRRRGGTDDRLALLFACCHPALAPEARLALTLRAVVGLTTPQIARAFLVHESTLAQRIVRAKRKIVSAHISLAVPAEAELTERLDDVLAVVYVMFNEGFVSSTGADPGPRPRRRRRLAGRRRRHRPARRGGGLGTGRAPHHPARAQPGPVRRRRPRAAARPGPRACGTRPRSPRASG